jgi:hypothetical protein
MVSVDERAGARSDPAAQFAKSVATLAAVGAAEGAQNDRAAQQCRYIERLSRLIDVNVLALEELWT